MIGETYWSTGITLRYEDSDTGDRQWMATLDFRNDRLLDDAEIGQIATGGQLQTLGALPSATAAAAAVKLDAERLGISLGDKPMIYLHQENWRAPNQEFGSPDVEATLSEVCSALGWSAAQLRRSELLELVNESR